MKIRASQFAFLFSVGSAIFAAFSIDNKFALIFNSLMVMAWGFRSIVNAIEESGVARDARSGPPQADKKENA